MIRIVGGAELGRCEFIGELEQDLLGDHAGQAVEHVAGVESALEPVPAVVDRKLLLRLAKIRVAGREFDLPALEREAKTSRTFMGEQRDPAERVGEPRSKRAVASAAAPDTLSAISRTVRSAHLRTERPRAARNMALLSLEWGAKNSITSSSKNVNPVAPNRIA